MKDEKGRTGWVLESLLADIHTGDVNIRTGPGTGYDIVYKTRRGVIFRIMGQKEGWLKLGHERRFIGWVRGDLVWGD